jgi:membrane-associated phospholipid phosphatase
MARISNFGDLAVALPVAAMVTLWLCCRMRWRAALWWIGGVGACVVSMFFIKLGFYTGDLALAGTLRNPSGHAAISMMVYGATACIIASQWKELGGAALAAGGIAILGIGVSLFYLRSHTVSEILAGLLVGGLWAALFLRYGYRRDEPQPGRPLSLVLLVAGTAIVAHGTHMPLGRAAAFLALPPDFIERL